MYQHTDCDRVCKNCKIKKTLFGLAARSSLFSNTSSFNLFFVLLPFFLKREINKNCELTFQMLVLKVKKLANRLWWNRVVSLSHLKLLTCGAGTAHFTGQECDKKREMKERVNNQGEIRSNKELIRNFESLPIGKRGQSLEEREGFSIVRILKLAMRLLQRALSALKRLEQSWQRTVDVQRKS